MNRMKLARTILTIRTMKLARTTKSTTNQTLDITATLDQTK
jgi:hypothetical protein